MASSVELCEASQCIFSRQISIDEALRSSRDAGGGPQVAAASGSALLPRGLPFVGFMRHAPPQGLYGLLDCLLRRRNLQAVEAAGPGEDSSSDDPSAGKPDGSRVCSDGLPRTSPYVGFQRHAPPSPKLCFSIAPLVVEPLLPTARALSVEELGLASVRDCDGGDSSEAVHCILPLLGLRSAPNPPVPASTRRDGCPPWRVPEEIWTTVLRFVVEVPAIRRLSAVSRAFEHALHMEEAWRGQTVRVPPASLAGLAPVFGAWLAAWRSVKKLVVPRSSQLLAEVSRRVPKLPIEVAWRFDGHLKGDGVEILLSGRAARRVSDEDLVVLGDASLPCGPGRPPYLEVRLDERSKQGAAASDGLNDFGLGVTACDPEELREIGSVADEVPKSWVVDFTQSSVVLSVNNHEAAKGRGVSAEDLFQGDRVGLRVMPDAIEVFVNGALRERLQPGLEEERVPEGVSLFPVLDLYGLSTQISRTDAEGPVP